MKLKFLKMKVLIVVQASILFVSFLFLCIGTFSNNWIKTKIQNDLFDHAGLYGTCTKSTCSLTTEPKTLTLIIIGFILEIHGLVLTILMLLRKENVLSIASLCYLSLSFIMNIAGWSLYVDNYNKQIEGNSDLFSFDWSLYLVLVSILLCFISIIISIISIFKERRNN